MGLDIGTRFISVFAYDFEGNQIASSKSPLPAMYFYDAKHPEWAFWDPEVVWNSSVKVIREAVKNLESNQQVKAISVTGVGMDGLPIDKNGAYLYPFISWHCSRTIKESHRWHNTIGPEQIFKIAGKQILSIDTVYRIMWFKENMPELFEKTYKWLMIEDYVNMKLCGEMVTDRSVASTTSLYDQTKQKWSSNLIKFAGFDTNILPEVSDSGTIIGNLTKIASGETGLPEGTPVVLGGHDYMCAALYAGAYKPGSVLDIAGSWEMLLAGSDEPLLTEEVFNAGFNIAGHVVKHKYAVVGETVSAYMIDWYKSLILPYMNGSNHESNWNELFKSINESECIPKGVFFIPHCNGAGSPTPDTRASGAFLGLNDNTDSKDLLRALVEGLNFQFNHMLESMTSALHINVSQIVAVGEESSNEFIMQNKADISGKTIEVPLVESATCLGAALLAGIGIGVYKDASDANACIKKTSKIYEPDFSSLHYYKNGFKVYKKIIQTIKELNWEIFDGFREKEF